MDQSPVGFAVTAKVRGWSSLSAATLGLLRGLPPSGSPGGSVSRGRRPPVAGEWGREAGVVVVRQQKKLLDADAARASAPRRRRIHGRRIRA